MARQFLRAAVAASSASSRKLSPFSFSLLLPRLFSTGVDICCDLIRATATPPGADLEKDLTVTLAHAASKLDSSTVESVIRRAPSSTPAHRAALLRFFVWAGLQPAYRHNAAAYSKACELLQLSRHPEHLDLLLDAYRREGVPVSARTFRVLFNLCRGSASPDQALRLLRRMGEFGCRPDTSSYNAVLRLLVVGGGDTDVAERLLEEMALAGVQPDMVTCVSMVKGLCNAGRFEDARCLVARMRALGCAPNVVIYSALLDGACKCGDPVAAMKLLEEMESGALGSSPNVVSYTCLMKCLCENGKAKDAADVLDRMRKQGCVPNRVTVTTLLKGLCSKGMFQEAFEVAERVVREGSLPSDDCYSSLMGCLLQLGQVEEAERLAKQMLASSVKPDGFARNALLRQLCSTGRFLDGFHWVGEMWREGLSLDQDVYSSLLAGACEEDYLLEAVALVKGMVQKGIQVSPPCLDRLVELLKKSGEIELVQQIMKG